MSAVQGDNDVRLRRVLCEPFPDPVWPSRISARTFRDRDEKALHELLSMAFDDCPSFATWWRALSGDAEFDPSLCFLAVEDGGRLAGAAQCWTSGFVKDLAVRPDLRGRGIGAALMLTAFQAFRERGVPHLDLKTDRMENAAAYRLYRRLGMEEVPWHG